MKFIVSRSKPKIYKTDIIVIGCYEREQEEGDTKVRPALIKHADGGIELDKALNGALSKQIAQEKFTGEKGKTRLLFTAQKIPAKFVLLIGLGKRAKFDLEVLREAGAKMAEAATDVNASSVALVLESDSAGEVVAADRARAIAEGVMLGSYTFKQYKTNGAKTPPIYEVTSFLYQGDAIPVRAAIEQGKILCEAQIKCRDLVNMPASDLTPTALAKYAKKIAQENPAIECTVLDVEGIKKAKMNTFLAVAKGSEQPPVFVVLKYRPKDKARTHVALIGKGITFDTGGISLKPPRGMNEMKSDMAGAATVMYVLEAIAKLNIGVEVTVYLPAAENMPDGKAVKPGDIVTARSGKTVEIVNTDAEGRLLVADALSYAADQKPDVMVDIATLTGGAPYCCGELYTLVMGNDQKVVDRLRRASDCAGELMWQLPIVDAYRKGYKSGIADLNNVGKGKAQTILGAIFLEEFVGEIPWAHLDIAASHWTEEPLPLSPRGATGACVRTLINFVLNYKKGLLE